MTSPKAGHYLTGEVGPSLVYVLFNVPPRGAVNSQSFSTRTGVISRPGGGHTRWGQIVIRSIIHATAQSSVTKSLVPFPQPLIPDAT